MAKFLIEYDLRVSRSMLVEAKDKDEALEKYENGDFIEDNEEDVLDEKIIDISEVAD